MFKTYNYKTYPLGTYVENVFDELFSSAFKELDTEKYPTTDIFTKNGITHIQIEVPGFSKHDIDISLEDSILIVKGNRELNENDKESFTRSLAKRNFVKKLSIDNNIENIKASVNNGILDIQLIEKQKKDKKKKIPIE